MADEIQNLFIEKTRSENYVDTKIENDDFFKIEVPEIALNLRAEEVLIENENAE